MGREILSLPAPTADERIAYGAHEFQFGDLRLPRGDGPHPVVIGIHGGYWRALYGLEYYGHICDALKTTGIATWNIEYRRLGNGGGWPHTFHDVALAADYLRVVAPTHNLDRSRVVALGHSAGGHLACWLAGRARIPLGDPLYSENPVQLKGVVSLAGVLDLRRAWEMRLSNNVTEELISGTPTNMGARYNSASPFDLLPLGVPQVIVHGTHDDAVPYEIAVRYHEAARAKGDDATLITLDGAGHFEMVDPRTREWGVVLEAIKQMHR